MYVHAYIYIYTRRYSISSMCIISITMFHHYCYHYYYHHYYYHYHYGLQASAEQPLATEAEKAIGAAVPGDICMYVCIYIYIYIYRHTYIYIYIYMYREREIEIEIEIDRYLHVCVYIYIYREREQGNRRMTFEATPEPFV